MEISATWKGGLSFEATADSGFKVNLGAEEDIGGANDGFRPLELMAVSLAGCTAMDVISILQKKRQNVTGFEVQVHAERAEEHPKVMTSAVIEYLVTGQGIDEEAVKRAIQLSATRYCPAQATLGKVIPITLQYKIFESGNAGSITLVHKSTFEPAKAS